jgi:hypothetical protein
VVTGRITGVNEEPDVYVSEVDGGGPHTGAVVSTTPIKAGDLTDDHVGRTLGFHDDQTQRNVPGEILRVERHDGPPPSVSVWLRCAAMPDGSGPRDDYMRVAPYFVLQLVEMLKF